MVRAGEYIRQTRDGHCRNCRCKARIPIGESLCQGCRKIHRMIRCGVCGRFVDLRFLGAAVEGPHICKRCRKHCSGRLEEAA